MYCSIEEAWPTYNYENNKISRANGVENFINNEVSNNSILNKNDQRPEFVNKNIPIKQISYTNTNQSQSLNEIQSSQYQQQQQTQQTQQTQPYQQQPYQYQQQQQTQPYQQQTQPPYQQHPHPHQYQQLQQNHSSSTYETRPFNNMNYLLEKYSTMKKDEEIKNKKTHDYLENYESNDCKKFMDHLQSCEECQMKIYNKFKPSKVEELLSLNPQIKETVVIFLIGLLILIILNLLYK